ncbi:MAG: hypothetical protein ACRC8S_13710 [Fimbriiglobus sp.]
MKDLNEPWREWLAILMIFGFAVAFVSLVTAQGIALCRPKITTENNIPSEVTTLSNFIIVRNQP